ncbi:hypothetical protein [Terrarubrum flagellatum]|uniref:hypothetical protein n=1 Tax=Terrirubrum flagellatum TaxID=2895980 RepID=UPI003144E0A8
MAPALPFVISVAVAAGNIFYAGNTSILAAIVLLLVGLAISIALAVSMRNAGLDRRKSVSPEAETRSEIERSP